MIERINCSIIEVVWDFTLLEKLSWCYANVYVEARQKEYSEIDCDEA